MKMTEKHEDGSHHKCHDKTSERLEIEKLKSEADSKSKELEEFKKFTQRLQADHENFRKRVEKENERVIKCSNQELLKKLVPVLDHFDLALCHNNDPGFAMIRDQLMNALETHGLSKIKAEKFDPRIHEAILMEESDLPPGTVIEELQKGYVVNDTIIRPAKVKIAKKREKNEA